MPFKSESQRRKFLVLKREGKIDQKTFDEWNNATPKDIPERLGGLTKDHLKLLNGHISHNKENPNKLSLKIIYKKLNGRTVKRKVDPHSTRNGLLFGYDHKRKATRSYRLERMIGMEKAANVGIMIPIHNTTYHSVVPLKTKEAKEEFVSQRTKSNRRGFGKHKYLALGGALGGVGGGLLAGLLGHHLGKNRGKDRAQKGYGDIRDNSIIGLEDKVRKYHSLNNPSQEKTAFFRGFEKRAGFIQRAVDGATGHNFGHAAEIAGLGALALHPAYELSKGKDKVRNSLELGGLGMLSVPSLAHAAKAVMTKKASEKISLFADYHFNKHNNDKPKIAALMIGGEQKDKSAILVHDKHPLDCYLQMGEYAKKQNGKLVLSNEYKKWIKSNFINNKHYDDFDKMHESMPEKSLIRMFKK